MTPSCWQPIHSKNLTSRLNLNLDGLATSCLSDIIRPYTVLYTKMYLLNAVWVSQINGTTAVLHRQYTVYTLPYLYRQVTN